MPEIRLVRSNSSPAALTSDVSKSALLAQSQSTKSQSTKSQSSQSLRRISSASSLAVLGDSFHEATSMPQGVTQRAWGLSQMREWHPLELLRHVLVAREHEHTLTPNERTLYYLKFVKPGDFVNKNSLYRDLVLTVLHFGAAGETDDQEVDHQGFMTELSTLMKQEREQVSKELKGHMEAYVRLTGCTPPEVFSSVDQEKLREILSNKDVSENEMAEHVSQFLNGAIDRYSHILSIVDPSQTESQHRDSLQSRLTNYFNTSTKLHDFMHHGRRQASENIFTHVDEYVRLTGGDAPDLFSSEDHEALHSILSELGRPEETAFKLCVLLENSLNRYAHVLSVVDTSKSESQHMMNIKAKVVKYFSESVAHQEVEGVTPDKGAKQLNNYLAYSLPSAMKKMMVIFSAAATGSFALNPDNLTSVTIRHSHHPVWGSVSASFISLLSAVQIYLTKPNTDVGDFLKTLQSSAKDAYRLMLSQGETLDQSVGRLPVATRIKKSLSEINQERWLLHLGGWSQLLNGLDHFLQMKNVRVPNFSLSTAFIYAIVMSTAEVPHAWHAIRDYRSARRAEKNLDTFFDNLPLDQHHAKDYLARSVRADLREDRHSDASEAFWTMFTNTAFATSMVSVFFGLLTGSVAPTHSSGVESFQPGIQDASQHGQTTYSAFAKPFLYGAIASFWLTGMAAHVVAATRQYMNYRKGQQETALVATDQAGQKTARLPTVETVEQAVTALNPQPVSLKERLSQCVRSLAWR